MSGVKRGNQWCLRRPVPVEFQPIQLRPEIWISLKTDSRRLAKEKAPEVWNEQVAAWKARLSGHVLHCVNLPITDFALAAKVRSGGPRCSIAQGGALASLGRSR